MVNTNQKNNILFLFNQKDVVGGGELSLLELLSHLDRERFQPFVICPGEGVISKQLEQKGFKISFVAMPSFKKGLQFLKGVSKLHRFIKRYRIALIHANGSRCALYAALAKKRTAAKLLWHVRIMKKDRWLDPFLVKYSDQIVTNSKAVRLRFSKKIRHVQVIYNGIEIKEFNNASSLKKELALPQSKSLIGMVGRVDNYKDYETFLHAAQKLSKSQASFVIVGEGARLPAIKKLARQLGLSQKVFFVGQREDIPNILKALDIFVLSTKSEGFGRALAEAMAMEKPVVATNVGGPREIVENNISGLLVKPKDPQDLAKKITFLLENKKKAAELGKQAKKRIQACFSLKEHMQKIETLYTKMCGIRLGIDCREFEKGKRTGIQRYLTRLIQDLHSQDWDLRLYGNQSTQWEPFVPENKIRTFREISTLWWDQVLLPGKIKKERCDLFFSPYFKAPLFCPCPLVLVVNDLIPKKNFYFRWLLRWNLKRAAVIIAISETTKKALIQFEPRIASKIRVTLLNANACFTPGPVNQKKLQEKYGVKKDYLLYVGNANPHKNLPALLKALQDIPGKKLLLCGISKEQKEKVFQWAKINQVASRVALFSDLSEEDLVQLYRGASVFVFPSLEEGFGLPPLEAMACGVPVVASQISATLEVLDAAPLWVDAQNPKDIALSVNRVLAEQPLRKKMIQKGLDRVASLNKLNQDHPMAAILNKIVAERVN